MRGRTCKLLHVYRNSLHADSRRRSSLRAANHNNARDDRIALRCEQSICTRPASILNRGRPRQRSSDFLFLQLAPVRTTRPVVAARRRFGHEELLCSEVTIASVRHSACSASGLCPLSSFDLGEILDIPYNMHRHGWNDSERTMCRWSDGRELIEDGETSRRDNVARRVRGGGPDSRCWNC